MGLDKDASKVLHTTAEDEENRYKAFAKLDEKLVGIEVHNVIKT